MIKVSVINQFSFFCQLSFCENKQKWSLDRSRNSYKQKKENQYAILIEKFEVKNVLKKKKIFIISHL